MSVPQEQEQPEFDPATWTPDKPWPKGYYKPVVGPDAWWAYQVARYRLNPDAGNGGLLWVICCVTLQWIGFVVARPGSGAHFGLMRDITGMITPWPLVLLFVLVLPALLFAGLVPKPGRPFSLTVLHSLFWTGILAALRLAIVNLPWAVSTVARLLF